MVYWLWIAISLTGAPGEWKHYPVDVYDSERGCMLARDAVTANFKQAYNEEPGKKWMLYCAKQGDA